MKPKKHNKIQNKKHENHLFEPILRVEQTGILFNIYNLKVV